MVSVTASEFKSVKNLSDDDITNINAEKLIDLAIDLLNLFGHVDLPNMSGTAGSKTVSLESNEKGAVFLVARQIYYGFYKDIETVGVGGLSVTLNDVLGNATIIDSIKEAARQLSEFDVGYG